MLPPVWELDGLVSIIWKMLKSSSLLHLESDQAYHQMEVAWQPGTGCTSHGSASLSWWFGEALGCISHQPIYCPSLFLSCCFSSSALIFLLPYYIYRFLFLFIYSALSLYFLPRFQSTFSGLLPPDSVRVFFPDFSWYSFPVLLFPHHFLSLSVFSPCLLLFSNILYENVQIYIQRRKNFT